MPDQQGTFMTTRPHSFAQQLQTVAELMLAVAGESVSVIKRAAPEQALKLKRQDEWTIYLEFLRVMFNLTDRVSALHIPLKEQPQFMDELTDTVIDQLKKALEPAFGAGSDQTEIVLTIGTAVAESRRPTSAIGSWSRKTARLRTTCTGISVTASPVRSELRGSPRVTAAATLCVSAVIPALIGIFEGTSAAGRRRGDSQPSRERRKQRASGSDRRRH